MDYKNLLRKYIKYIDEVEGSNFISFAEHKYTNPSTKDIFTEDEWEELKALAK
jgi:hypothetical protein